MPLTRSQVESVLVARRASALTACYVTATPSADASPRAYLGEILARGLREQSVSVADPTSPTDAECAIAADADRLFDVAELFLLRRLVDGFVQVTWSTPDQKQALSDYRTDLMAQLARHEEYVRRVHGHGLARASAMVLDLGFAQHGCPGADTTT